MFFKIGVQFRNINKKISVLESLFNKVDSKDTKKGPTEVFYGTPPVAPSVVLKNSYIHRKAPVADA